MKRRREKQNNGYGSFVRLLAFIIFLVVIIGGGWLMYYEGTLPVNKDSKESKIFVIEQGENVNSITNNLKNEELIRNKLAFYLVVKQKGLEKKIQAGQFRLSPSLNSFEIAEALTHGTIDEWVQVIEGQRKEEVAKVLAETEAFEFSEIDFVAKAEEGYLFPDKYLIPRGATTDDIIKLFTDTFEQKVTPEIRKKIEDQGLTLEEGIIMASMVEREARTEKARTEVASILLKRYQEDGWVLNIDATIQYALGYDKNEQTWWKQHLTFDDLEIDSPYNTYTNAGLPPTPICNPSLSSILAVANADPSTPYYFYITDPQGRMHYAVTNAEHEENIAKYLR